MTVDKDVQNHCLSVVFHYISDKSTKNFNIMDNVYYVSKRDSTNKLYYVEQSPLTNTAAFGN